MAIFGAGAAGVGLHAALVHARSHDVVCYFDDNPAMQGRLIRGVQVQNPANLAEQVRAHRRPLLRGALGIMDLELQHPRPSVAAGTPGSRSRGQNALV